MTTAPCLIDPDEIRRTWRLLREEGETGEVRILGVSNAIWNGHRDARHYKTAFGMFRDEDAMAETTIRALGSSRFRGIYQTLNPVRPEVFSRAANELRPAEEKDSLTADADILRRHWLLVDLDFKRPAGISTTDAEHQAALSLARRIAQEMTTRHGWPPPVLADSGNGAHLLWRISLPADDGGLVKRVLARLQKDFAADGVDVDQTVHNAGRITKSYGTLAAKGSNTQERPHRMSRILEIPEDLRPVPSVLLEDYAGAPEQAPTPKPEAATDGLDLEALIRTHWPDAKKKTTADGGWIHELPECPWEPEHRGSAFAGRRANGALFAGCHGNRCQGKKWEDFKEFLGIKARNFPHPAPESEPEPWPEPTPFTAPTDLADFPIEALPHPLADFAREASQTIQIAIEAPAVAALACLSAAAARNFVVSVGETHEEPVNIFTSIVMEAGERKTEVFKRTTAPMGDLEKELSEQMAPEIAKAQAKRSIQDQRLAELTKRAAKEDDAQERTRLEEEAGQLAAELVTVPAAPRLIVGDITTEKLVTTMAEQGGRIGDFDADSGLFEILAGRYSGQPNFESILKAHAGDTIRVSRYARQELIERPALTLAIFVQPSVVEGLASVPGFRGRGLLGRFLWVMPESAVGTRIYRNRPMNPTAVAAYSAAIKAVFRIPKAPGDEPHRLALTGDALEEWATFANRIEREQVEGGRLRGIRDWASKAAGLAARIAGLFHVLRYRDSHPAGFEIGLEDVVSATALVDWATDHALAVYGLMEADEQVGLAKRLLRWIERTQGDARIFKPSGETMAFSLRDCHQHHRNVGRPEDLLPGLEILESRGYVRRLPDPPKAPHRPKSPRFEIRPLDTKVTELTKPSPHHRQEPPFVTFVTSVSKERIA